MIICLSEMKPSSDRFKTNTCLLLNNPMPIWDSEKTPICFIISFNSKSSFLNISEKKINSILKWNPSFVSNSSHGDDRFIRSCCVGGVSAVLEAWVLWSFPPCTHQPSHTEDITFYLQMTRAEKADHNKQTATQHLVEITRLFTVNNITDCYQTL